MKATVGKVSKALALPWTRYRVGTATLAVIAGAAASTLWFYRQPPDQKRVTPSRTRVAVNLEVSDPLGARIPSVTVTLEDDGSRQSGQTDREGYILFPDVACEKPVVFNLAATGFRKKRAEIRLNCGEVLATQKLTMEGDGIGARGLLQELEPVIGRTDTVHPSRVASQESVTPETGSPHLVAPLTGPASGNHAPQPVPTRGLAIIAAASPIVAPPSEPRAGTSKFNPKEGLTYVWIPPGTFTMGCSPGDPECRVNEQPAHPVTITKGFWMGQTDVTVGALKRYRSATGKPALPTSDSMGRNNLNEANESDSMPIVFVTWDEARDFCVWSGGRLPTEAEWEYAARAGSSAARYGNLDEIAWYGDNSGRQRIDSAGIWNTDQKNHAKRLFENGNLPHPAGQKQPNGWNLYDMLGNVQQWTSDWYTDQLPNASIDPTGPASGGRRALRGGSWDTFPSYVRVSARGSAEPGRRLDGIGVRCVGE